MEAIRVSSWNELNAQLYAGAWQEPIGRFRSTQAFRGMSHVDHDLTSSLIRLGLRYEKQEGHMLRNFRKYAQKVTLPGDSVWNWLALAQHHGMPTRLLDWTYSPFVGLHFATDALENADVDSIVWRIDSIANLNDWVAAHPSLCGKIIVPADLKWEVRDKLNQANITERVLFPGLDGLSRFQRQNANSNLILFGNRASWY